MYQYKYIRLQKLVFFAELYISLGFIRQLCLNKGLLHRGWGGGVRWLISIQFVLLSAKIVDDCYQLTWTRLEKKKSAKAETPNCTEAVSSPFYIKGTNQRVVGSRNWTRSPALPGREGEHRPCLGKQSQGRLQVVPAASPAGWGVPGGTKSEINPVGWPACNIADGRGWLTSFEGLFRCRWRILFRSVDPDGVLRRLVAAASMEANESRWLISHH